MSKILSRLNYANVMATVAVFLALGGGAIAATKIGKNAVKTKSIANLAVTTKKLGNNAVTEAKVKPIAFQNASGFTNGWAASGALPAPQFGQDSNGVVHLQGNIAGGTDNQSAFTLPSGFRPTGARAYAVTSGFSTECTLIVSLAGTVTPTGCNNLFVALDPITFVASK